MNRPRAKRKWGQHWLASDELADRLVADMEARAGETFLEIGPGRGRLTHALLRADAHVVALEIDPECCEALRRQPHPCLRVIQTDVLESDALVPWSDGPFRVAGNLPYNVSSPILSWIVRHADAVLDAHLMLQLEVAERVAASPGSRDFGLLSLRVQSRFTPRLLRKLSPHSFRPPPKVDSALLRLQPRRRREVPADDWLPVAEAAFAHRRKTLLRSLVLSGFEAARVRAACSAAGVPETARAEVLAESDFVGLARALADERDT